jgi:hypothetical protein
VLDFGLVTGQTGATGAQGDTGPDGLAASIAIGTVSAVPYGSAPSVVNSGTPTAAVLDWTLVTGPTGPAGSSSSVLEFQFQTATTAPPGNGHVRLDNTPALTDTIFVSHIDGNGIDQDYILLLVQTGSNLIIQRKNDSTIAYTYEVLSSVANTGYVTYTVNFVSAAGTLANNDQVVLLLVAVGQPGTAATVNVGTVTQVPYGPTAITVTNIGTTSAALLDFVLCPGPDGAPGSNGAAASVAVGTTSTLAPGQPATVVNVGTSSAAVLDFGIPAGATGASGAAATLTIGSTTTLPAGSSATASNSGTSSAAILNLGIPIGDPGTAASIAVGSVSNLPPGSTPTVTNVGSSGAAVLNFGLVEGAQGQTGLGATVAVGTVSTLAAGQPATVTNVGTPSAVVLNYGIPQGQTGSQGVQGIPGPPGPAGGNAAYAKFTRSTNNATAGFYADSYVVIGWNSSSNELNIRQPTARASVYAVLGINNGGSFPSGQSMILTVTNDDYWYQPSTGSISFTISSDIDGTHPFYKVSVTMSGAGGANYIYTVVQIYT